MWLTSLPHQIPFRAASAVTRRDETTIEGTFLVTANDPLPFEIMIVEAMAQFAGGLAFHERKGHGFLSGVDRCEVVRPVVAGEIVHVTVKMEASFGGIFRFTGSGSVDGVEVVRGRFYLSEPPTA
jgi:3-hydroxymyristoyl/3-hydroxydecanoyl-(acyl carrier protein) dehydratase